MPRVDAMLGTCSLPALRRRKSVKWRTYPRDVLPAFIAEMDFDVAEPITEAVRAALAAGDCGYAHKGALGEAFAAFSWQRHGWSPAESRMFPIPDVMTGIAEVIMAITPPGSGVVINTPVYPPFSLRIGFAGRRVVEAPLRLLADGRHELDPEALDRALSQEGVSCYLLCSPHNPLGRLWPREQLLTAADICLRHDAMLLIDEIHGPLVLSGALQVPFGSLDHEMTERSFVFTSATKGWNIPGLKCGVAVAGSEEGAALLDERWGSLLACNLGVLGSVAAFTESLPWLDAVLAQLDQNRRLLSALLGEHLPAVRYVQPEASFLAWLDCRKLGLGDDPSAVFLDRGRVALASGTSYGPRGAGYARLNIGTSPELMTEAVLRMARAAPAEK